MEKTLQTSKQPAKSNTMNGSVDQECPPGGCWWQKADITRRVLSFLTSNQDVLNCDSVCKQWSDLKAHLPQPITLDTPDLQQDNPAAHVWLQRNLPRTRRLVLHSGAADLLQQLHLPQATALQCIEVVEAATLRQLPAGLGSLPELSELHFYKCPLLADFPPDLEQLTALQKLSVLGTPCSLTELPEGLSALTRLQNLRLHGCHLLQEVPPVIGSLTSLTRLELDVDCDSPELLPSLQTPAHLTAISDSISQLSGLRHLGLRGANQLRQLPDVFGGFSSLQELELVGLHAIATLPDSLGQLSALTRLLLHGANALEELPDSISNLVNLKWCSMVYCHRLVHIPPALGELSSLEHLVLGCHGLLQALPDNLGSLSGLTHLSIETASLSHLPESVGNLGSLRELIFNHCHCLQALPESVGRLSSLELLSINTCMHLTLLPDSLTRLSALTALIIHNAEAWPVKLPSLPRAIGTLPKLRKLSLTTQFPPDETTLPELPASLALSSSLQEIQWGNLRLARVPGATALGLEALN